MERAPAELLPIMPPKFAGLNSRASAGGIYVENVIQVFAAIEDDSGTDGLSGQAGSPAACNNGDVHFYGDLHGGHQVGDVPRDNHAQRLDLVDAGVGAVESARGGIEANLALDMAAQMLGQGGALLLNEICHEGIVRPSVQSGKRVLSGGRKPP